MKLFQPKPSNSHIDLNLSPEERKKAIARINRIIGQLNSVKKDLEDDHACEESLIQLQAARGAIASLINILIEEGILECLSEYPQDQINSIIRKILSGKMT